MTLTRDLHPVADLPSNGQLVTIRGRNWVVTDVQPSALPYDVTAAAQGEGATFVSLSSVEDDGLGEELRVLWELESGRKVLNRATLPDVSEGRFADPTQLGAFLDACVGEQSRAPRRPSFRLLSGPGSRSRTTSSNRPSGR